MVYGKDQSTITISNTSCSDNFADENGGGIYITKQCSLVIRKKTQFKNNRVLIDGGGIYITDGSSLVIENGTQFENNTALKDGGAIKSDDISRINIYEASFSNNTAYGDGGAIKLDHNGNIRIESVSFYGNRALSGGAVALENSVTMETVRCWFEENTAVQVGGAVVVMDHSSCKDTGSSFISNRASDRGQ